MRARFWRRFRCAAGWASRALAANLATGLAQLWNCPTVLVDLSLMAGHSALMLNLAQRNTWADVAHLPVEEIDAELVSSLLMPHGSGAFLLAAPRRPEDSELITGERVTRVLTLLRERYHYIVLDLPHDFRETTLAGSGHGARDSDGHVARSGLGAVDASALDIFETLHYPRDIIKLVLNQTFRAQRAGAESHRGRAEADVLIWWCRTAPKWRKPSTWASRVVMSAPTCARGHVLEDFVFRVSKDEHRKQRPEHPTLPGSA